MSDERRKHVIPGEVITSRPMRPEENVVFDGKNISSTLGKYIPVRGSTRTASSYISEVPTIVDDIFLPSKTTFSSGRMGLEVITSWNHVFASFVAHWTISAVAVPFVTEPNLSNMTGLLAAAISSIALSEPFDSHSSFFSVPDDLRTE